MSGAPETIWMDGDIEKGDGYWTRCFETEKPCSEPAIAYRRADLPLTAAELLADPRVKALVEAMDGLQQFFAMPDECSIGRFDRLAEQYRRETGNFAPGKSIPSAYNDSTDCETRRKDYDDWVQSKVTACRAALAQLKEPKP